VKIIEKRRFGIVMSKTNNIYTSIVMFAAILLLAGCSRQESAPATAVAPTAAPATTAPVPAAPAPTPAAKWLASTQGDYPGITIAVQELKRGPYALKLKLVLINESGDAFRFEDKFGDWRDIGGIHLIDMTNKRKYFVVRDHDGTCLCSRNLPIDLDNGSRMVLWAEYPLPPDDVQKISVEGQHFPPMEDVPISR
jgi:hypothetical protein